MARRPDSWRPLRRGDVAALAYRLGRALATGDLWIATPENQITLRIHRGKLISRPDEDAPAKRMALLAPREGRYCFTGASHTCDPADRTLCLAAWSRRHLEAQLDASRAANLVGELAGQRLAIRPQLSPPARMLDETDRRIVAAMTPARRLDQIWPIARTPRFRLLAFLHFIRAVGALQASGVAAEIARPDPQRLAAHRLLGVRPGDGPDTIKRAYRQMVRTLHPDLQPTATHSRRRYLEGRLVDVNRAYDLLS